MGHQRTDAVVISDAERKNATTAKLKRHLRRSYGIRDPHTSPKAREAIRRAAIGRAVA